jgi:hypothetical protein
MKGARWKRLREFRFPIREGPQRFFAFMGIEHSRALTRIRSQKRGAGQAAGQASPSSF